MFSLQLPQHCASYYSRYPAGSGVCLLDANYLWAMVEQQPHSPVTRRTTSIGTILSQLPPEVRQWAEALPWTQRRYVLSLCHLLCAAPPQVQAEFLDDYTADGLISKFLEDKDTQQRVANYLHQFHIDTDLSEPVLRYYIRQFYIHSAQDVRQQPDLYLESALKLVLHTEERNHVFCYILGFELLQMMFRMSWQQHEWLSQLQKNQEEFIKTYLKPIQHAHRLNSIIVPKDERIFFAQRDYYVQIPEVTPHKTIALVTATFTTSTVTDFGFSIIRHINSFRFDYDYVFRPEQPSIFVDPFKESSP